MALFEVNKNPDFSEQYVLDFFKNLTPEGNFYQVKTEYLKSYEFEYLNKYKPSLVEIKESDKVKNDPNYLLPDHWLELIYKLSKGYTCIISHDNLFRGEIKHWFHNDYSGRIIKRKNRNAPVMVECTKEVLIGPDSVHMLWFPGIKGYIFEQAYLKKVKKLARKKKLTKDDVYEFLNNVKMIFTPSADESGMLLISNDLTATDFESLIAA